MSSVAPTKVAKQQLACAVVVVAIVVGGICYNARVVQPKRNLVRAFTNLYIAPYSVLKPIPPYTIYHSGNQLIWIACTHPSAIECAEHACMRNVFAQNQTNALALCNAVLHDCHVDANRCTIQADCNSMGGMRYTGAMLYVYPCDEEPSSDYEMADKITADVRATLTLNTERSAHEN